MQKDPDLSEAALLLARFEGERDALRKEFNRLKTMLEIVQADLRSLDSQMKTLKEIDDGRKTETRRPKA